MVTTENLSQKIEGDLMRAKLWSREYNKKKVWGFNEVGHLDAMKGK